LRAAMRERRVSMQVQDRVVNSIRSFALYGFPESHAISFALLAYASAWFRAHRLAEFTTALLNHQPMGFYSPSTLVRDARQHGLRIKPVCVSASEIGCTVDDDETIRLGLNQVRGLSRSSASRIIEARRECPWQDMEDFLLRCHLPRDEKRLLARAGALNSLSQHRREALWEVELPTRQDLFSTLPKAAEEMSPLAMMTPVERLEADYASTALTVGPHPMNLVRHQFPDTTAAAALKTLHHGAPVRVAGMVICRQRPGTAKGNVFISLEDETGISNVFVPSVLFEKERLTLTQERFLYFEGRLQHVDNVISVYAQKVTLLPYEVAVKVGSHDFH
jgi:error-prone DNA polymerase